MIDRIIEFSMQNRAVVFIAVAFLTVAGIWAISESPLDALPDLSDTQVIVFTEWMGRSPDLVEDQVTYPISSALLAAPKVQYVRGQSMFGMSFVTAVFEDGTDIYWARSRVLEYLNQAQDALPPDAVPTLGPDATGVGWVFQYMLVDRSGQNDLADLRTFQDWYLRFWLESLPGVAEVASVGGFVKQYQVLVDPVKLLAYGVPLPRVVEAIRSSNRDVGGRTLEMAGTEVMVRGLGYLTSIEDLEEVVVASANGTPVRVRDIATVELGGDQRRGLAEWNGEGEAVGGIVVMRYGENALDVIERVKERLAQIEPALPPGVEIEIGYDRSGLIHEAIATLQDVLLKEIVIVLLIIGIFLLHLRSSLVVVITLPVAVVVSFIFIYVSGITVNVMSLGGIAIAIGAMVDAAVVLVENAHKRLEQWHEDEEDTREWSQVLMDATKEVGRPIFFALLVITVSFLPVFALGDQEGRLFRPLAFTKTFAMLVAAFLSVTLSAALVSLLVRGRIRAERDNPISRVSHRLYLPSVKLALRAPWAMVGAAALLVGLSFFVYMDLGSEFMPPLEEGAILYMPTAPPGMSVAEAQRLLNIQGQILASFPEVESVMGKIGRAETATDPAPLSMVETTVMLKPTTEWRGVPRQRWWHRWSSAEPGEGGGGPLRRLWPDVRPLSWDELIADMDEALRFPGMPNIWWMPVQTRTEMIATGVRSELALKVFGPDLATAEEAAVALEEVLKGVEGARTVFAERPTAGVYLDVHPDRAEAARYGLTTDDVNMMVETAVGGLNITQTVEGRERYPVAVRYGRDLRQDAEEIARVFVPTPAGAQVPLGMLAAIDFVEGPPMIGTEGGQFRNLVTVNVRGRDIGSFVEEANARIAEAVTLPPGVRLEWGGQFEYLERFRERLRVLLPLTLTIIFFLLYMSFRSVARTLIVLGSVPFAAVGAFVFLWLLDINMSAAVWVGIIALSGVAAETGVVMIVYLDAATRRRLERGEMRGLPDLEAAIIEGAVQRLRPKLMTVVTSILALLPIMFAVGVGATAMQSIAAPMIGGLVTSLLLTLIIIPSIYLLWQRQVLRREPFWEQGDR